MPRPDLRPICTCSAYRFPHKLGGGKCHAYDFAEYQFLYDHTTCEFCNLNATTHCDAATGAESILHGECYKEAIGGGQVLLTPSTDPDDEERFIHSQSVDKPL